MQSNGLYMYTCNFISALMTLLQLTMTINLNIICASKLCPGHVYDFEWMSEESCHSLHLNKKTIINFKKNSVVFFPFQTTLV